MVMIYNLALRWPEF